MAGRSGLFTMGGMLLAMALPRGVNWVALGLDDGVDSFRLWAGLPLLAAGIVGLECLRRCVALMGTDPARLGVEPREARQMIGAIRAIEVVVLVLLPVTTTLLFVLLLDGHVRLRACGWMFVAYAAGAAVVWAAGQVPTRLGSCYLRWGWAPLIAFGVPLALPAMMAVGLVSPLVPPR